ncbi:translation initiation factor IF-3 [Mycoplasma wenyonii]|uniref:Translation initiation factor IF-3 n=1 Tax=Mycoplasma wenyonii TaxID=65123 RepID=A0A328PJC7_9MOLU|nr:translation initiation factor IF-3 [Mycoplasma wenyonii]
MLNEDIQGDSFRLVEGEGASRVVSREEMFSIAKQRQLDLLLVNNKTNPPVVKLLNFSEFQREQSKQAYQSSKKEKGKVSIKQKSITLKLKIDEHDLQWKVKKTKEWLGSGEKVQLIIRTPYEISETKAIIANNLFKRFSELVKEEGRSLEPLKSISPSQYTCVFHPHSDIKK